LCSGGAAHATGLTRSVSNLSATTMICLRRR